MRQVCQRQDCAGYRQRGCTGQKTGKLRFSTESWGDEMICHIKGCKYKDYRAIGTVGECRKAAEKQIPKKPSIEGDGYDNDGNMIYDTWICPECGKRFEVDCDRYKYCPECGQHLDLSEID